MAVLKINCHKDFFRTRGIPSRDGGYSHVYLFIRIKDFYDVPFTEAGIKIKVND